MRIRCWRAYAVAALLGAARATSEVTVDDTDPGIEYRGSWVHNAIDDPKDFNYGGSTTFTNATGSTATYRFQGIAIAVYGAFEVAGTFAMHSSYSIDSGAPADFLPAGTVLRPAYRQKFFQSGTLADGAHTLVITNLEREFWLDYLVVTQPAAESTSVTARPASTSAAPQQATTSTTQAAPVTTASSTGQLSSFTPSSQTAQSTSTSTHSFSNTNNFTLTSSEGAVAPSLTASQSQTSSVPAPGAASPSSTATRAELPAGAIAGAAVGGLLVLALIGVIGYRCRRRQQARRRRSDPTPYGTSEVEVLRTEKTELTSQTVLVLTPPADPELTAPAPTLEPSEKRGLQHDSDSNNDRASGGSGTTSTLTLPLPAAPDTPYPAATRASGTSMECSISHENKKTHFNTAGAAAEGMDRGSGERRTGFESLGSSSSASPLLSRTRTLTDSSATPFQYRNRLAVDIETGGGKRSLDGGVRLAGGPLDARGGVSTLPPAYQVYPVE